MRARGDARDSNAHVIEWLLDADPSIRWQVMRDLTDTPAPSVEAERSRVATEGWGARLLDRQRADGQWGDGAATPFWWSNLYTLLFLRDLGLDPESERARTAIDRVRGVTWGPEFGNSPFFEGEVEPCINGRVVALGAYFGERSDRLVDRLLGEQLADGGWNCEAERGSVRSSFHTTICVLEGLLAFEQAFGAAPAITTARTRAQAYLLERRLLRKLSTGEIIHPAWTQFAFPTLWHYDVLRAIDYFRATGGPPDPRVAEAITIVRDRRQADGRWLLDVRHKDTLHEEVAGPVGAPNRWLTLRALRVLDWYARSDDEGESMHKPDFSGEWTLNVGASMLSPVVAPVVQSGFVRIDHREPTVAVHLSITMDGKPFDVRFERSSNWDGDALTFIDKTDTPGGELTISFRYQLEDAGRRLRATERLRGAGREQDNVWVFDRAPVRSA